MKNTTFFFTVLLFTMSAMSQVTRFYKDGKVSYRDAYNIPVAGLYDAGGDFSEGLALVVKNEKRGFINESGFEVIEPQYTDASSFHDGLAAVKNGSHYGYIDKEGKVIIPFIYEEAGVFLNKLARVKKNGKYGFIDSEGKEMINAVYDNATIFFEGYASVQLQGKWGYINNKGELIISYQFDNTMPFVNSIARVVIGAEILKIDPMGNIISRRPVEIGEDCERECKEMQEYIEKGEKKAVGSRKLTVKL